MEDNLRRKKDWYFVPDAAKLQRCVLLLKKLFLDLDSDCMKDR
jgi:hypothetical protein